MILVQKVSRLQNLIGRLEKRGTIGFVPTMGDLHEGHLSLVRRSQKDNRFTVVSIFVNPIQFNQKKDYQKYHRDEKADSLKLKRARADALFLPEAAEIYPPGFQTEVSVNKLSQPLCGHYRPGHFTGVATVVLKLFNLVRPDRAYFGLKDFQQCRVIQQMVRDLDLDVKIVACPIVREPDGLAMSSRNRRLSPEERGRARRIFSALHSIGDLIKLSKGIGKIAVLSRFKNTLLLKSKDRLEYLQVVDPETLEPLKKIAPPALIATAVWIGETRLIDNLLVES